MWLPNPAQAPALSVSALHLPAPFGHDIIHRCAVGEFISVCNALILTGCPCLLESNCTSTMHIGIVDSFK
jgi:hypothetical protein